MISTAIDAKPTTLYRLYDAEDALLYVGIATNPGRRFKQHADRQPWWPDVTDIKVELYASTQDAHAAEIAAIRAEQPRHNAMTYPSPDQVAHAIRSSQQTPYEWLGADMDEIVNLADIARRVGVSRQAVWELSRRDPAFPSPLPTPSRNRLYAWPAVRDYYQGRNVPAVAVPDPGKEP